MWKPLSVSLSLCLFLLLYIDIIDRHSIKYIYFICKYILYIIYNIFIVYLYIIYIVYREQYICVYIYVYIYM